MLLRAVAPATFEHIDGGEATVSADYVVELRRASAALSRANRLALEPWRSMSGALLDAVIALEELVEESSGESDG